MLPCTDKSTLSIAASRRKKQNSLQQMRKHTKIGNISSSPSHFQAHRYQHTFIFLQKIWYQTHFDIVLMIKCDDHAPSKHRTNPKESQTHELEQRQAGRVEGGGAQPSRDMSKITPILLSRPPCSQTIMPRTFTTTLMDREILDQCSHKAAISDMQ